MNDSGTRNSAVRARLAEELRRYAAVSLYLFVCFGVVTIYDASQSSTRSAPGVQFSFALVNALIMGKFILIGEALKLGTRLRTPTLLHRIAWRSLGMLALLIVLKCAEEIVKAMVHSVPLRELLSELSQRSWLGLFGPILLLLLILIPLTAAVELGRALGPRKVRELLFGTPKPPA